MGAVVALRANGRIYLAADRMKNRRDFYWRTSEALNLKIHKLKNGVIIGAVGSSCQAQRFYLNESWFNTPKGVAFDKKFLATSVIPKYQSLLDEQNLLDEPENESEDYPKTSASFIVVNGEDAFLVDENFGVFVIKDFAFISSDNQRRCLKALAAAIDKSDPERFMVDLFKQASEVLGDMVSEIVIIDSASKEFKFTGGSK